MYLKKVHPLLCSLCEWNQLTVLKPTNPRLICTTVPSWAISVLPHTLVGLTGLSLVLKLPHVQKHLAQSCPSLESALRHVITQTNPGEQSWAEDHGEGFFPEWGPEAFVPSQWRTKQKRFQHLEKWSRWLWGLQQWNLKHSSPTSARLILPFISIGDDPALPSSSRSSAKRSEQRASNPDITRMTH